MFQLSEKIEDTIQDEVSVMLQALNQRQGWNSQAIAHLAQLTKQLKQRRYKAFVGHPKRYHLTRIGESCLYDVPMYRKGFLADFRGKRIRLVCVSSGRYERLLMAGVVGITPSSQLRVKKEIRYVFPEFGDHKMTYLGRRYMLIQTSGKFSVPFYQGAIESIDPGSCDFILLDGKECCPIATLQRESDGTLIGTLIGWRLGERYGSVSEAIRALAKISDRCSTVAYR